MEDFDWISYLIKLGPFIVILWYIRYIATGKKWL